VRNKLESGGVIPICCSFQHFSVALILPPASAQQILFTHAPNDGPPWPVEDVYSMNADGSGVKALTSDGLSHDAVWTADGRGILFVHDGALQTPTRPERKGFESYHSAELYAMDRDGGNRRLLRRLDGAIFSVAMSPDGKSLAMTYSPEARSPGQAMRPGFICFPPMLKASHDLW
jgi:Tol biopolymer transport system component